MYRFWGTFPAERSFVSQPRKKESWEIEWVIFALRRLEKKLNVILLICTAWLSEKWQQLGTVSWPWIYEIVGSFVCSGFIRCIVEIKSKV